MSERVRLFLDDRYVECSRNLSREWGRPVKHPQNPVMVADRPWENGFVFPYKGTVHYDPVDGTYRLWYQSYNMQAAKSSLICYATSADGIRWEKPELGVVAYNGERDNNIILAGHYDTSNVNVFRDDAEDDPARRFKNLSMDIAVGSFDPALAAAIERGVPLDKPAQRKLVRDGIAGGHFGAFASYSPDGIHWTAHSDAPTWPERTADGHFSGFGDTFFVHRDPRLNRFVAYTRCRDPISEEGEQHFRIIGRSETEDFESWPDPQAVLCPDSDDPPGLQFYCLSVNVTS